ncbi:MAG TPA: glycine--tRNA ligase subunit beta [Burkholderiales bacterium]|nr:glycine--tRNA ligase subunit beta [Burkholderiales bacterium]
MPDTLLIEILTEELPPKSLRALSEAFRDRVCGDLVKAQLARRDAAAKSYATPRRLAVSIPDVGAAGEDRETEVTGPSAKAPAQAIEGFAKKHGVSAASLERRETQKGEVVVARVKVKGQVLEQVLASVVEDALKSLPIPKVMRWGDGDAQFVRPVHGLVMLHGKRTVPGKVLGLESTNHTRGHRFMGKGEIALASADEYEAKLKNEGMVIADFDARRVEIERQLKAEAGREKAALGGYEDLLEEVTALVEHPSVYVGAFDASFLEVPQECLILTMRQNQKYFPLFDAAGKLLPRFLIVSNMKVADPRPIIGGNERVVRPRLEDARFFYNQDRRIRLEERVPQLAKVVYHNKLGSQLDRVTRIQLLAGRICRSLGADPTQAERAAWLSKADLLTGMVGEFPELQGVMGGYYALHDGEPKEVARAIAQHYKPRFAGDTLPEGGVACAVALADKLDALSGLFGIGQQPTGEKDPFGLRRAALGVVRILVERRLALSLQDLVKPDVQAFILERFAGYLKDQGFSTLQVDSVLSQNPARLDRVPQQLEAVKAFEALPEAESLAAANKRVANILKQAEAKGESFAKAERKELKEAAEISLFDALQQATGNANPLFERGDYAGYLKTFAVLKAPVDVFFDKVMVMAEQKALRQNRLALLAELRTAMNRIADISKLAQ